MNRHAAIGPTGKRPGPTKFTFGPFVHAEMHNSSQANTLIQLYITLTCLQAHTGLHASPKGTDAHKRMSMNSCMHVCKHKPPRHNTHHASQPLHHAYTRMVFAIYAFSDLCFTDSSLPVLLVPDCIWPRAPGTSNPETRQARAPKHTSKASSSGTRRKPERPLSSSPRFS